VNSSNIAGSKRAVPEYSGLTRLFNVSNAIIAFLRVSGDGVASAEDSARASYIKPNKAKNSAVGSVLGI
jgi:hypothetical protein